MKGLRTRGISTVMAIIIVIAITVAIVIAVMLWMGILVNMFQRYEDIEIKTAHAYRVGEIYVVTISYENTGSAATSLDSITLNDIPLDDYVPIPVLGGAFAILPSPAEIGVSHEGIIVFKSGIVDTSGNQLGPGITLMVDLHTSGGRDYATSIALP